MAQLHELDLLSPEPYPLARVGHVCSPTLRQISTIGYDSYNAYLSLLSLHAGPLAGSAPFHTMTDSPEPRALLAAALSFFLTEEAVYSEAHGAFLCMHDGQPVGMISADNFDEVCACILQRNHADSARPAEKQFHNDKAREIYEKLQRAKRRAPQERQKAKGDMSLPNLISALCVQHNSINMINVWDLTVYQLYDQFLRQSYLNQVQIHAMNYAGWGGEFDPTDWYRKL